MIEEELLKVMYIMYVYPTLAGVTMHARFLLNKYIHFYKLSVPVTHLKLGFLYKQRFSENYSESHIRYIGTVTFTLVTIVIVNLRYLTKLFGTSPKK